MVYFAARTIATFFGSGLLPKAPGTWGSLAALPLISLTKQHSACAQLLFWSAVLALGVWSAGFVERVSSKKDNQTIVIDEVLGMAVTCAFIGTDLPHLALAFVFFRIFDILKPFPARQVDRYFKGLSAHASTSNLAGGAGVILDDLIAGVYGVLALGLLDFFFIF